MGKIMMTPPPRTEIALLLFAALVLLAMAMTAGCESQPQKPVSPVTITATVPVPPATRSASVSLITFSPGVTTPQKTNTVPGTLTTHESNPIDLVTKPPLQGKNPDYIKMDSDNYNRGEVVEFYLRNIGSEPIQCGTSEPGYSVSLLFQNGSRKIVSRSGGFLQVITEIPPGSATRTQTLDTTSWIAGRYLIQFGCGKDISREFILRD
jgi:hypothetical protein